MPTRSWQLFRDRKAGLHLEPGGAAKWAAATVTAGYNTELCIST